MPNIGSASTIENVQLTEQASAPATPDAGFFRLYVSSGSVLRGLDSAGNDFPFSTTSLPADIAIKTANETITGVWTFTTISGSPTFDGHNVYDLRENNITIGSILSRPDQPSTISTSWTFQTLPKLGSENGYIKLTTGSITTSATIPETDIADGTVLARVGSAETITTGWTFQTLPTLGTGSGYVTLTTGAISSTASIPETDIADGSIFPRLAAAETITANAWTFKAINVGRVQVLSATGTYNDWAPTGAAGCSFFDIVPATAANVVITGLSFSQADGRVLFLFNNQGYAGGTITLKHEDAGSLSANRIYTPGGTDYVLGTGVGCVLVYNAARWLIMGKA